MLVDVSVQEEEKKGSRTPEEAMGGRRHWHSGHPFEQTRGGSEGEEPGVLQSTGSQGWTQLSD